MEEKNNFGRRLEEFFVGKGFYIVLLLSAAAIAATIWLLASRSETDVESETDKPVMYLSADITPEEYPEGDAVQTMDEEEETGVVIAPEPPAVQEVPVAAPEEPHSAADVFIWPVSGPVERGYAVETLSYDRTMSDWRTHGGVDLAAEPGTSVLSAANGTVRRVYTDDLYGTVVEIDHGNGLVSVYANLQSVPAVSAGMWVPVGATVGAVGDTALGESAEVSHLHFAMEKDGESVDPANYLPKR